MSEKHKNVCQALNYFQNFLDFAYDINHSVSIASLVCISLGITSSELGIKTFATTK